MILLFQRYRFIFLTIYWPKIKKIKHLLDFIIIVIIIYIFAGTVLILFVPDLKKYFYPLWPPQLYTL